MTKNLGRSILAGLAGMLLLVGCGGTMAFSDTSSIVIEGTPPPPPPPPPPPKPEPPPKPKRVEVTADKIVINDKILFEVNKAVIRSESNDLLNEIVSVINENSFIKKISIEGHTDSDGSEKYNEKLSDKRAAAVLQYLVDHGVDAGRLTSKGYGESKPIADNATEEGKEKNRRVEFLITEQAEVKEVYEVDPKTGEKKLVKQEVKKAAKAEDKAEKAEDKAEKAEEKAQ